MESKGPRVFCSWLMLFFVVEFPRCLRVFRPSNGFHAQVMLVEAWKAHELTIAGVKSFTNAVPRFSMSS